MQISHLTFQYNQFALNNNPDRSNCNVGNEIINNNEINSEKIIFKKVRNKNVTLRAGIEPARREPKRFRVRCINHSPITALDDVAYKSMSI